MIAVGDIVIFHQDKGTPSRFGISQHPAIVTNINDGSLDLTVFFHNWEPGVVSAVPFGDESTDIAHWEERP